METVGELGVFLILFCCGLEFSPTSFVKACSIVLMASAYLSASLSFRVPICQSV